MTATSPQQIGRFRVEALLGQGAMGVVYKAHDPEIERPVAIKLIHAELLRGDSRQNYLARFRNEAKVAGRCVHSNIVAVYDYSVEGDSPYLVMEYVEGIDLGRAMRRQARFDEATVVRIALRVLDALNYAHALDIVHRDIKPSNIMLTARSGLKVADFGISRLISFEATQSSAVVGTPSYMAPEQYRGGSIDGRCDLFSLGCVIYELLSGQRAFGGTNYAESIYQLIHEPHRPVGDLRPGISPALAEVIDRALAKSPDQRFDDAAAMAAALRGINNGAPPVGPPEGDAPTIIGQPSEIFDAIAGSAGTGTNLPSIADPSLATIERRLASYLGPMAGYKLRQALSRSRGAIEFCELLSNELPEGSARDTFMRDALALLKIGGRGTGNAGGTSGSAITTADLEALKRALAQVMGPIASHVIQRMQGPGQSTAELEAACAGVIENPRQRRQFSHLFAQYRARGAAGER
jgi:eukaryotic-like serine/threonine-protein kinase